MKVVVQIPCLNEEETLPLVLESIPERIDGVDELEILVIDDGSTDRTVEVAKEMGLETPAMSAAYLFRVRSEDQPHYTGRLQSLIRVMSGINEV